MTWDYKRDLEVLANVVKMQHTFHFHVGEKFYSPASINPFECVSFACPAEGRT